MAEFRMPSLGADMESGTLVEWTVKPGHHVRRGDIIALVDTEKGLIEIEVFEDGVVESLIASPGATLAVGAVMAIIRKATEAAVPQGGAKEAPPRVAPPPVAPAAVAPPPVERPRVAPVPRVAGTRPQASPRARRRAEELGIDIASVTPSEGGVIRVSDVDRTAAKAAAPPRKTEEAPPRTAERAGATAEQRAAAMRKVIAAAMARSKREIPHYYLETHVDAGRALAWLNERNRERSIKERLLLSALLLKAVALAVREVPELNGYWIEGGFRASPSVHVGMAISLRQGGLVAPALHDVDRKPLDVLMKEMLDLTQRVRSGVMRSSEIADATITVTSLGDQGVESVFGVIYPPQVALVGFGKVVERPWAVEGMVGVRPIVSVTLAADHRASDGHRGGRFLTALDRLLQEPGKL